MKLKLHMPKRGCTEAQTQEILNLLHKIMSAISDYNDKVQAAFGEISTAVDDIQTGINGVTTDVASLKQIILDLQNNPGPISPQDQALLDQGVAQVTALNDKLKTLGSAIKELDAQTETAPTPPAA